MTLEELYMQKEAHAFLQSQRLQHAMHKPLQLCPAPPPPSPVAALQERQRLPLRMTEWDGQPRSFYLPPEHKARSGGRGAK